MNKTRSCTKYNKDNKDEVAWAISATIPGRSSHECRVHERGFNRVAVDLFFNIIASLMDKHKFSQSNIYNCDETGISTVHIRHSKTDDVGIERQAPCR